MKQQYLEQALQQLDDEVIAGAARPMVKKPRHWGKIALVAACCAALMVVTVGAGAAFWQYTFRQEDKVTVVEHQIDPEAPPAEKVPDGIYLPAVRPGDEHLEEIEQIGTHIRWYWHIDGRIPVILTQDPVTVDTKTVYPTATGDYSQKTGQVEWDGVTVAYHALYFRGNIMRTGLYWEDGTYQYSLHYSLAGLEELKDFVTSMERISDEEFQALKAMTQKPKAVPARHVLQQVLLPGGSLEDTDFRYTLEDTRLTWSFSTKDNYGLYQAAFYQEDLKCPVYEEGEGETRRRWKMQDNPYASQAELAGMSVQLLESDGLWEYFWEQDGNWCVLSVSKEVADLMDLTMEELAQQIVGSLILVPAADAQAALDGMK